MLPPWEKLGFWKWQSNTLVWVCWANPTPPGACLLLGPKQRLEWAKGRVFVSTACPASALELGRTIHRFVTWQKGSEQMSDVYTAFAADGVKLLDSTLSK